ncbi:MAG: hypothetical protein Q8L81_10070 [Bacteroidota bacterium]|nr:hypothetical protein [Bacteroidota bacterium]
MKKDEIKIACIGNMNNNMFTVVRYLKDEGYCVTLFLLDEYGHFLPEADTFDKVDVEVKNLGWNKFTFHQESKESIKKKFEGYNFFIGTDWAPAYLFKAGILLDIFCPAGSDLFEYPFCKLEKIRPLPTIAGIEGWRCSKYQYYGIRYTRYISMEPTNAELERYVKEICSVNSKRIPALPFLYIKQYNENYFQKSEFYERVKKIRNESDILIVQHCRQEWKGDKESFHYKANQIFLKGFRDFISSVPKVRVNLLLLEYGTDVNASKELILELGLQDRVHWLPTTLRKNLIGVIDLCDIGVGELGKSWVVYGSVLEILSVGKIFIGRRNDKEYSENYSYLYPMFNAVSAEDVTKSLIEISLDLNKQKLIALTGKKWLEEEIINKSIKTLNGCIENKAMSESNYSKVVPFKVELTLFTYTLCSYFIIILNYFKIKLTRSYNPHAV